MKQVLIILFFLAFTSSVFSQDKTCCTTYVFDGYIETEKGQKIKINFNFLVLLDSTLVGSYYYTPKDGSLKLAGQLYKDNSFELVERDNNGTITGFFKGRLNPDKSTAEGFWNSPK